MAVGVEVITKHKAHLENPRPYGLCEFREASSSHVFSAKRVNFSECIKQNAKPELDGNSSGKVYCSTKQMILTVDVFVRPS